MAIVFDSITRGGDARAVRSRIAALVKFAKNLKAHLSTIIHRPPSMVVEHQQVEGIKNKIKVIMRMAYGFRDDEHFFLEIRAAFPGIPG